MNKRSILCALSGTALVIFFLSSCTSKKEAVELKTTNGFKYILFTDSNSTVSPKIGNYVTVHMTVLNAKDSVFYDSHKKGMPFRFQMNSIPFKGSYEDGLTNITEGDSAEFYVPADSLYTHFYAGHSLDSFPQSKTAFIPGSFMRFRIKLMKVQTANKAELEQQLVLSERERSQDTLIKTFAIRNHLGEPDTAGYYLIYKSHGKGAQIRKGMRVKMDFVGATIDGHVFQNTVTQKQPYEFIFGKNQVIPGFELTFPKFRQGDHISLVLPSKLAYKEDGIRNPSNGTFIIQPFSALIFDIKFLEVGQPGPLSKK